MTFGDGPKVRLTEPKPGERNSALSVAIQLYVGIGVSACPTRLPSALEAYFGSERAARLREQAEQLLSEAWLDVQDWGTSDLVEATQRVADRIGHNHPELSPDAVRALAWNFSYSNR